MPSKPCTTNADCPAPKIVAGMIWQIDNSCGRVTTNLGKTATVEQGCRARSEVHHSDICCPSLVSGEALFLVDHTVSNIEATDMRWSMLKGKLHPATDARAQHDHEAQRASDEAVPDA